MAVQWRARALLPTYRRGRSTDGSPRVTSRDQALPAVCALPRDGSDDDVQYVQHQTTSRSIKRQPTQLVGLDELDHITRLTRSDDLSAQIYLAGR
jgi:hypothetical protein